ncbi:hypothetical protein BACCAC_00689 [Bacteroides caccae ATCC 43185]|nr:hypothetical protein BACCAC_00689 [Bacteroides caccae ATCC 43185]
MLLILTIIFLKRLLQDEKCSLQIMLIQHDIPVKDYTLMSYDQSPLGNLKPFRCR